MAAPSPNYLMLKINALLDGQQFLDHWSEKFRNAQVYGTGIKALCPFHLGESFRTFLLDLRKKTFRCTITQCKAAGGGTFAHLHALLVDKPPLEAMQDLCTTFKIVLPDDLRVLFATALANRATELFRERKLETAENMAVQAFKRDSGSVPLKLLLAEICEARGRPADARPYYETVLREAISEGKWAKAGDVLARLQAMGSDRGAYAEQAAAIAEAQGNRAQAASFYLELGLRADVEPERRRKWLEKARSLDSNRAEILAALGDLAEQMGQTDAAVEIWKTLALRYREAREPRKALAVFDQIARLCPDLPGLNEQRADLMLESEAPEEAAQLLKTLARQALEQGSDERAERYLRRLCEAFPTDVESHWQLLTLFERTDREDNAALMADYLFAIGDAGTMGDRYVEVLQRLRRWRPDNILYRERLAKHCAEQGDLETAMAEMRELVERSFKRNAPADATQRIQTMRALAADHPRHRLGVAELLAAHGYVAEAAAEYESIAQQCAADDAALARDACIRGIAADPSQPGLHETLLRVALVHDPALALEQGRWLADFYRMRGEAGNAVALIEDLAGRSPRAGEPRLLLAQILLEEGQSDRVMGVLQEVASLDVTEEQVAKGVEIANALSVKLGESADLLQIRASLYRRHPDQNALIETLLRLAAVQQLAGLANESEASLAEVLDLRPTEERALLSRAELVHRERGFLAAKEFYLRHAEQLMATGRADEAGGLYQHYLELEPEDPDLHQALAALLSRQGDAEKARAQWERAAAYYLISDDNPAGAAGCYETILTQFPADAGVRDTLIKLHVLTGDLVAARQLLPQRGAQLPDRALASHEVLLRAFATANRATEAFQEAWTLSELYEQQGRLDAALDMTRRMVEILPQEPTAYTRMIAVLEKRHDTGELCKAYVALSELHERLDNLKGAAEALERYLAVGPAANDVRKRFVSLAAKCGYQGRAVDDCVALIAQAREAGNVNEAAELYALAALIDPENVAVRERQVQFLYEQKREEEGNRALVGLADCLARGDRVKEAVHVLSERIKSSPRAANLYARLGDFLLALRAKGRALISFMKAAEILLETNDHAAFHPIAEKILAIDPQDVATRSALINSLVANGQIEAALTHTRVLGGQYAERHLYDLAEHEYRQVVSYQPDDLVSWQKILEMVERLGSQHEHVSDYLLVAQMLAQRGLPDEAIRLHRQAVQLDPENIEARRALIETHLQVGREQDVVPDYLELADLLVKRDMKEDAVKIYARVLAIDPKNGPASYQLNRLKPPLARETGMVRAAGASYMGSAVLGNEETLLQLLENYRNILKTGPENSMIRVRMADVLYQLGKTEEALTEWEKASDDLLNTGDHESVIRLCERIQQVAPDRRQIQERLSRARLRKDSMSAIESVIDSLEKD